MTNKQTEPFDINVWRNDKEGYEVCTRSGRAVTDLIYYEPYGVMIGLVAGTSDPLRVWEASGRIDALEIDAPSDLVHPISPKVVKWEDMPDGTRWVDGMGELRLLDNSICGCRISELDNEESPKLVESAPIPWFGGECPVPEGVMVNAWSRDGYKTDSAKSAGVYRWSHHGDVSDIIAYQIVGLADDYVMENSND